MSEAKKMALQKLLHEVKQWKKSGMKKKKDPEEYGANDSNDPEPDDKDPNEIVEGENDMSGGGPGEGGPTSGGLDKIIKKILGRSGGVL
jgi:hypothetical protein